MKISTKAALFSGLVFPGTGLYLLKHYIRGSIFFVPALLMVLYIGNGLAAVYSELSTKLNANPQALPDIAKLTSDVQASLMAHLPHYHQAISLFVIAWIISTISSYFAGKKQELAASQTTIAG